MQARLRAGDAVGASPNIGPAKVYRDDAAIGHVVVLPTQGNPGPGGSVPASDTIGLGTVFIDTRKAHARFGPWVFVHCGRVGIERPVRESEQFEGVKNRRTGPGDRR